MLHKHNDVLQKIIICLLIWEAMKHLLGMYIFLRKTYFYAFIDKISNHLVVISFNLYRFDIFLICRGFSEIDNGSITKYLQSITFLITLLLIVWLCVWRLLFGEYYANVNLIVICTCRNQTIYFLMDVPYIKSRLSHVSIHEIDMSFMANRCVYIWNVS